MKDIIEFNERIETMIGYVGEEMIKEIFENNGCVVYTTRTKKSHPVDLIVFDGKDDKMIYVEIKTKPRRCFYEDTGINLKSCWKRYNRLINRFKVNLFIYFIDEFEECIYSINLNKIIKNFKFHVEDKIIYFNLCDCEFQRFLTKEELESIRNIRIENNYPIPNETNYINTKKYFQTLR